MACAGPDATSTRDEPADDEDLLRYREFEAAQGRLRYSVLFEGELRGEDAQMWLRRADDLLRVDVAALSDRGIGGDTGIRRQTVRRENMKSAKTNSVLESVRVMTAMPLLVLAVGLGACGSVETGNGQPSGNALGPDSARTVSAGFGETELFESFESAERTLGWRVMRPSDPRFRLVRQGGLIRTDAAIGLARTEQAYAMDGREGLIEIFQQPEVYSVRRIDDPVPTTIGTFSGELGGELPHALFEFFSGEQATGNRIRVLVYTNESSDLSERDFIDFVSSLRFGEVQP